MFIGVILIMIGLVALGLKTGVISGSLFGWIWPLFLILVGFWFLIRRGRGNGWCCGHWHAKDEDK